MGRLAGQRQGFLKFFIFCFYNLRVCCRHHDTSIPCTRSLLASAHEADFVNFFPSLTSSWLPDVCYVAIFTIPWKLTLQQTRVFSLWSQLLNVYHHTMQVSPNSKNFLLQTCNSVITGKRSRPDAIPVPNTQFTFTFP